MKNKFLILICCLLLPATALLANTHEVKRLVTKQFKVSPGTELGIINKYGNIVITVWNKNEIDFSIEIIGKSDDKNIAQQMADRVSIDFNQSGKQVSAETVFAQQRNFNCNNCGTTINYTVNVPASVLLNLTNKYGNVRLDETTQPFTSDVKYGNIYATRLGGENNHILLKYGNLEVNESNKLTLEAKYSNLRIDKVDKLKLDCAYSKIVSDEIGSLDATSKYDKFTLQTIGTFVLNSGYTDINIGSLTECFDASSLRYCKLKIENVSQNFSSIRISASYTPIRIGISEKHNFRLDLSTRYGNIRTNASKLSYLSTGDEKDRYTKSLSGTVGNEENPKAVIKITDSYADIILSK